MDNTVNIEENLIKNNYINIHKVREHIFII